MNTLFESNLSPSQAHSCYVCNLFASNTADLAKLMIQSLQLKMYHKLNIYQILRCHTFLLLCSRCICLPSMRIFLGKLDLPLHSHDRFIECHTIELYFDRDSLSCHVNDSSTHWSLPCRNWTTCHSLALWLSSSSWRWIWRMVEPENRVNFMTLQIWYFSYPVFVISYYARICRGTMT